MPGTPADLNRETYELVAKLLGAARAADLLGLLRETAVLLGEMRDDELTAAAGLAGIHRLKSEAGLMGFDRLSRACEAVDTAGARGAVPPRDLRDLRDAIASALNIADTLGKPGP